jgi:hypothetical protein
MLKNIFAYTAPTGIYPQYLSVNEDPKGDISVIVRSPATTLGGEGHSASVSITRAQATELKDALTAAGI